MLKFGVILFPGSNSDYDAYYAASEVAGQEARFIWHKEQHLGDVDVVIIPGGFSYGDYLRAGAIARFSPIMKDIIRFAHDGGAVLGICNGFQILCECGLLPGALIRNAHLRFVSEEVHIRVEQVDSPFTHNLAEGDVLQISIAHGEGNYVADQDVLDQLEANGQVAFRYVESNGVVTEDANPNGSLNNIAGILNEGRNVLGMMPHPERCAEPLISSGDGLKVFQSLMTHASLVS